MANSTSILGEFVDLASDLIDNVTAIAQLEPEQRDAARVTLAETAEALRALEHGVRHSEDIAPHADRLAELAEAILQHADGALAAHRIAHYRRHLGGEAVADLPKQIAADESASLRVIETAASEFAALATGLDRGR